MFLEFRCVKITTPAFQVRMVEFTEIDKVLSAQQVRISWARQCATVSQVDMCLPLSNIMFQSKQRANKKLVY
jgi:hypothetical protein